MYSNFISFFQKQSYGPIAFLFTDDTQYRYVVIQPTNQHLFNFDGKIYLYKQRVIEGYEYIEFSKTQTRKIIMGLNPNIIDQKISNQMTGKVVVNKEFNKTIKINDLLNTGIQRGVFRLTWLYSIDFSLYRLYKK